jgi:hypothetical protein
VPDERPVPRDAGLGRGAVTLHQFYDFTSTGALRCRVCGELDARHATTCALVTLRIQVQELGSQLGFYVANMRELLDTVDAIMRGDEGAR